jgi:hypothetical protein
VLIDIEVCDTTLYYFSIACSVAAEIRVRLILISIHTVPFLSSRLLGRLRVICNTNLIYLLPMTLVSCLRIELGIHSN